MIDLLLKSFPLALQSIAFVPQGVALALGPLGPLSPSPFARGLGGLGRLRRFRHVPVMPEFAKRYKTR